MSLPVPFPKCANCGTDITQLEDAVQTPTVVDGRKTFIWTHNECPA